MCDNESEHSSAMSKILSPVTIGHQMLNHRVRHVDHSDRHPATKALSLKWKAALDAGFGQRLKSAHEVNHVHNEESPNKTKRNVSEPDTLRKASHKLCCVPWCKE